MISSRRSRLLTLAAALLGGCATAPQAPLSVAPVELTAVPFFPQTDYQCGPAALATLLAQAGAPVTAEDLVPEVYVEGLRGSLQPELLGATRRNHLIPYVVAPDPAAMLAELRAGRPVLVLQNLGLAKVPVWHYAVVVGMNDDSVILRSGTVQRRVERKARFLRSWQRAGNWGFVALQPGALPATDNASSYVRALAGAESLLPPTATASAYAAGLDRWPNDELVLFAAAGHRLGTHDLVGATTLYRKLLAMAPQHAAARNNLANVLAERGCYATALREAHLALAAVNPGDELYAPISDTVREIERAAGDGNPESTACSP